MRVRAVLLPLFAFAGAAVAQDLELPRPPPMEPVPCPPPEVSQPVVSYRISDLCEVTRVQIVGEYRFGSSEVRRQVQGFAQAETERRLSGGTWVYVQRIEIPLHRALEPPARLVCRSDMMRTRILNAEIVRPGVESPVHEPVSLVDGRLPDLGLFTYTRDVEVPREDCPGADAP